MSNITARWKLHRYRTPDTEIPDVVFNAVVATLLGCFLVGYGCQQAAALGA